MSVNKVILVGNVGKDPEVRYLDEGTPIAKFPMATSETYKNRAGERVSTTEWHNVVLWRGLAQVAEKYVKKGTQLYIEGRIKTRSYDDAEGNKKYITEITGDQLQLLGRRPDESGEGGQAPAAPAQQPSQGQSPAAGQPAADQSPAAGQPAADQPPAAGQPAADQPPVSGQSPEGKAPTQDDKFTGGNDGPDDLPF